VSKTVLEEAKASDHVGNSSSSDIDSSSDSDYSPTAPVPNPAASLQVPMDSSVSWQAFLAGLQVREVDVLGSAFYEFHSTTTGCKLGRIHLFSGGLWNQKCTCSKGHAKCVCWVRIPPKKRLHQNGWHAVLRDLVHWLNLDCSKDEHASTAKYVKRKHGMRVRK